MEFYDMLKSVGDQNGVGYCLFPVLGHDTVDGVATVGAMACTAGTPACRIEGLCAHARAWEGLSRQSS